MNLGEPTLDQLRIFIAVAEEGSFGAAGRRLSRAVSAISYGIAQLEAQLGLSVFAREGSRKPVLTPAGRGLLAEARRVIHASDAVQAKAQSLHAGLESELSVVVDVMMPGEAIAAILRDFRRMFPTVALRLNVEALGAVAECLVRQDAALAFAGPVISDHPKLDRQVIGQVELVPVAAPDHPLAAPDIRPGQSREHLQLVLSDRSRLTQGREFSVLSPSTWRLGDLGAKHTLLKEGIGWGNMPLHQVRGDIAQGHLVLLDLPEKPGALYPLSAMWRREHRPGPAASWLIDAMREGLAKPAE